MYPRVLPHMPRSRLGPCAAVLCLTLAAGCGESLLSPASEQDFAEQALDRWVREHPAEWAMAASTTNVPQRPHWTPACSDPLTNGYVSLRLLTTRGELELAFRCPLDEYATAQQLQDHFVRAVPWNLAQGISAPNWRFQAWMPESSIFDGVTFHNTATGALAVNIVTPLSGLRAESTRGACAAAPGGEGAPEGCTLRRRHAIPLQIRFTAPMDLSALR
jgi:hypothetical protein